MSASAGPHCPRDGAPTLEGPAPEFAPGSKVFGRFEIGEAVARGHTGTVYRARDEAGAPIALKVVHEELTKSPVDRSRIKRELTKATSVVHAQIVRVREVGETEGRIFLVRDFVEGDALASLLRRDGAMTVPRAARIVHGVASALVEAHRAGVLHRDLNPRHVIVQPDGTPAILDFALSAPIPGGIAGKPAQGSLESLAPEQAGGKLVTLRADLYAVGLMLREMLTGEPASLPDEPAAALAARAEAEAPPAPPGVPPAVATLLAQLLARDPKDRPFGARAVEKVLAELAREAAPRATTAPLKPAVRFVEDAAEVGPARIAPPRGATLPMRPVLTEPGGDAVAVSLSAPVLAEGTQPYATLPMATPPEGATAPPLEHQLDEALEVVAREGKRRDDSTAVLASDARPSAPSPRPRPPSARPIVPPVAGRAPLPRAAKKTLIGIPLPTAPDPPTAVRQKWARSVLGLEGEDEVSAEKLGLPDSLEPPRRVGTAQGTGPALTAPAPSPPVPTMPTAPTMPAPAASAPAMPAPALAEPEPFTFDDEPVADEAPELPAPPPAPALADLEAAASALSGSGVAAAPGAPPLPGEDAFALPFAAPAAAVHPPVPVMPTAGLRAPAAFDGPTGTLAARDSAPAETLAPRDDTADAIALMRPRSGRLWLLLGAAGLGAVVVVGVVLAVSGSGGGGPGPAGGGGPGTHPTGPVGTPPAPVPPTPVPPLPPAVADAGSAAVAPDGGAVAAPDGGAAVATLDGGATPAADGGVAVVPAVPDGGTGAADGGATVASVPVVPPTPVPPPEVTPRGPPDNDPRSSADLIKLARANVRKRRWADARRAFDIVLNRDPDSLDALLGAALVAVSEHQHEVAVRHFRRAVQLRPDSATFHVYLGNAYLMNDDRASAETEWRRALEIDPTQREARQRLGLGGRAPRPAPAPPRPAPAPPRAAPAPPRAAPHAPPTKAPTKAPAHAIRRNPYR